MAHSVNQSPHGHEEERGEKQTNFGGWTAMYIWGGLLTDRLENKQKKLASSGCASRKPDQEEEEEEREFGAVCGVLIQNKWLQ